jgi:hypothetical protein
MPRITVMAGKRPPGAKREEGAPVPKDEIDPELVSLRGPRAKVGAITALAIVVVCGVYLIRLLGDFAFARAGVEPREVKVSELLAGDVGGSELVSLHAQLERSAAVRVRTGAGDPGQRIAPVVGTHDMLWIAVSGDPGAPYADGRYVGRVHGTGSGPLAAAMRDYLATPQPRFVTGAELQRARTASGDGGDLKTVDGDPITARADTPIEIGVVDPNAAKLAVIFTDKQKDVKAWTDALAAAGIVAPGTAPTETTKDGATWQLHVTTGDAVASTEAKLEKAGLWASRVDAVSVARKASWKELSATPAELTIGGASLPWSAVDVAAVWVPRPLPDGARVLVADERPSDYKLVQPLYIALALLGLLFAWALWRAVKRDWLPA